MGEGRLIVSSWFEKPSRGKGGLIISSWFEKASGTSAAFISGELGSWEQELTTSTTCVSEMLLEVDESDGTGATATSLDWNQTIYLFLKVYAIESIQISKQLL